MFLSSQIIGPALFGFTYIRTVAVFPAAIFFVSAGIVVVSFVLFSFVRVPKESVEEVIDDMEDQVAGPLPIAHDETLLDLESEDHNSEGHMDQQRDNDPAENTLVDV
jgi:hypothetical protein